jgi:hypothetical protein
MKLVPSRAAVRGLARRVAPATADDLAFARRSREGDALERLERLEAELVELRAELDESRKDAHRIAELYDVVVERLSRP